MQMARSVSAAGSSKSAAAKFVFPERAMDTTTIKDYFTGLQNGIVATLEAFDGKPFQRDEWQRPAGGGGITRVIEEGNFFERGGVAFSHVMGEGMPPSATA